MRKTLRILLVALIVGCTKDNKTFTLKTISLNGYKKTNGLSELLYLKVLDDHAILLAQTKGYPSNLTLPTTFNVMPNVPMTLYNRSYTVQLWGDTTGYISSCKIDISEYKIIFPINIEVRNDSLSISTAGSWR